MTYIKNFNYYCLILSILFFLTTDLQAAFFENKSNFLFLEKLFYKKQKYILFLVFFFPSIIFYNNKKFLLFSLFTLFQFFVIIYWQSLILWIRELAGDSLSEINTFNIYFIISWLKSIFNYLEPNLRINSFIKFYLIGFLLFFVFKKVFKKRKVYLVYFPSFLFCLFVYLFINFNINHLIGNITTQKDIKNYFNNSKFNYKANNKINFILFIGESNSSMHTTRNLEKLNSDKDLLTKGNFINYRNIYSTHTHSTPTLLRLFSLPSHGKNENLIKPIVSRESENIFSFFNEEIKKTYISSTGIDGFNNIHYSIFFKNFEKKFFLNKSKFKYEKEFFLEKLKTTLNEKNNENLIVFHSSVGHAPYEKYFPKKKNNEDYDYSRNYQNKLFGNDKTSIKDFVNYENALEYNFQILKEIIMEIDNKIPTIMIYLSDHGESVYTGIGHDSSRLVHEMLRIPFLIYFNKEFEKLYNNNLIELRSFVDQINTSDIFKEILLDTYSLVNIEKDSKFIKNKFDKIIFQRNKKDVIEYIDLNYDRIDLPKKYINKNDKDTNIHILSKNISDEQICYHASNTIARINRGLHITSCLEFDLIVDDNQFYIYHPPSKNIGFTFDELIKYSGKAKSFWLDAKNINDANNCNKLNNKIQNLKIKKKIFVEFPSHTTLEDKDMLNCIKKMKSNNIEVSYYISNDDIDKCLESLIMENLHCNKLLNLVSFIDVKNEFNNISFDFKFMKILDFFKFEPVNLKLNTWHIDFAEVKQLDFNKFNLVIPYNSNYNKNIF
tara:strand:- start:4194 stop:6524 length:2331 start_codon:yes stop_codon:yes gene_type:complete